MTPGNVVYLKSCIINKSLLETNGILFVTTTFYENVLNDIKPYIDRPAIVIFDMLSYDSDDSKFASIEFDGSEFKKDSYKEINYIKDRALYFKRRATLE